MTEIIALPGSLRRESFNRKLLLAAAALAPEWAEVRVDSIAGIPLYDRDVEDREGQPKASEALKERIAAADGLLIATPEYDGSIPGVVKNAIDWLSRPADDVERVFADLPTGVIGATPGRGGTRGSQTAWLPIFRYLGVRPWFGSTLFVAGAGGVFGDDGEIVDEKVRELTERYITGFAEHCRDHPRQAPDAG